MNSISGIGKLDRRRLSEVLRRTKGTISVRDCSGILKITPSPAAKLLARWASKGWLSRVRRGLYVPIPLESRTADVFPEDPWLIAERLFAPCYIGGWSAAEHWGLTEQIFRTVFVMTTKKPRGRDQQIKGIGFKLRSISQKELFGLRSAWRTQVKIGVSDPTRTVLDMLNDPRAGGGLRPAVDVFRSYLRSEHKNLDMLLAYADRLGNGAVFKRLGYLAELYAGGERKLIEACRARLTEGKAKLDPGLPSERLVTRWRLWIPRGWPKGKSGD
jgi:predicted transcriptional regulator of viral defense system